MITRKKWSVKERRAEAGKDRRKGKDMKLVGFQGNPTQILMDENYEWKKYGGSYHCLTLFSWTERQGVTPRLSLQRGLKTSITVLQSCYSFPSVKEQDQPRSPTRPSHPFLADLGGTLACKTMWNMAPGKGRGWKHEYQWRRPASRRQAHCGWDHREGRVPIGV